MAESAGKRFFEALNLEKPLQMVGTINAYTAIMAQRVGFHAIYLSGAGVANSSYGLPDLGLTTLENVLEDASRITSAVNLPLLVDIDTGWDSSLMIERAIKELLHVGVAGVHIEDQVSTKKCGHLADKEIVPKEEMVDRISAAVEAKGDNSFVIMARTDAFAAEGLDGAIERALAYKDAGADMLFPEAMAELEHYRTIRNAVGIPILANLTEFGKTPLFTLNELKDAEVDIALYPLSANRAMNKAALDVFKEIRQHETQKGCLDQMQTREELYDFLKYDPRKC
ncbi:MAG: 2-methylisocitrate lyase [Chlamydiae bacterium]|nr:2-methylisocitrate lyase [Chlamydiota bacterium]